VEYLFSLYDEDNSKSLSLEEGLSMISDLFGNNFRSDPDAFRIYRELQVQLRKTMTFTVFNELLRLNPMILRHVKEFQFALRHRILNLDFWIRAGKRRTEAYGPKLYISPQMIFDKAQARVYRPNMPEEILKFKRKEKRKVEDENGKIDESERDAAWGSPEWKEMRMSKNNPQLL
jgi:hypothetical protein